jgi:hypothetical protein
MDDLRLDAYDVGEPDPALADRVFERLDAIPRRGPLGRWPLGRWAIAAAAVAAACVAVMFSLRGGSGVIDAEARTSVSLAGRGVAVAEPGARVRWSVGRAGDAELEQSAGTVFYRVEHGGAFVVKTPGGSVRVQGTCFKVEVEDMRVSKQGVTGAVLGASVVAAAWVTVYEGKVSLAHGGSEVALTAGQRGVSRNGEAPREVAPEERPGSTSAVAAVAPPPSANATQADLLQRDELQRRQIAALTEKLRALETTAQGGTSAKEDRNRRENPVDPSKEELLDLAKRCRLTYDVPSIQEGPSRWATDLPKELGLTPEEQQAANRAHQKFNDQTLAQLRAIYGEIVGDPKLGAQLSPDALSSEIQHKGGSPEEIQQIFKRLSAERAGLLQPPKDSAGESPVERYYRLMTQAGESFEHDLAGIIGPDRAHDARTAHGGWNNKYGMGRGCPNE